jgi:chemotaxis protein MotB
LEARLAALLNDRDANALSAEELRAKLSAALVARLAAENEIVVQLSEVERQQLLLAQARTELSAVEAIGADDARSVTLLNEQVEVLRAQLSQLQGLLDDAQTRDSDAQVQIQALGSQLNQALAQVAAEQRARADAEAARAQLLEDENLNLESFRSEFFGRLREILADQEGVRIVGDRFVFSSSVLFPPGGVDLSGAGQGQLARIASTIREIEVNVPDGIDWILRVDGHTDDVPIGGGGKYENNWELSQGRALSVVQFMIQSGIPPQRLAAAGFGEYRPIADGTSTAARSQNRRIELKLTQR